MSPEDIEKIKTQIYTQLREAIEEDPDDHEYRAVLEMSWHDLQKDRRTFKDILEWMDEENWDLTDKVSTVVFALSKSAEDEDIQRLLGEIYHG